MPLGLQWEVHAWWGMSVQDKRVTGLLAWWWATSPPPAPATCHPRPSSITPQGETNVSQFLTHGSPLGYGNHKIETDYLSWTLPDTSSTYKSINPFIQCIDTSWPWFVCFDLHWVSFHNKVLPYKCDWAQQITQCYSTVIDIYLSTTWLTRARKYLH